MKIVVTHTTGTTGRRELLELLAPEFSVRVIASDPARLPEEIRTQVEVVRGASDGPGTLRRVLDGAESLSWSGIGRRRIFVLVRSDEVAAGDGRARPLRTLRSRRVSGHSRNEHGRAQGRERPTPPHQRLLRSGRKAICSLATIK
jgi:hypothetical protein